MIILGFVLINNTIGINIISVHLLEVLFPGIEITGNFHNPFSHIMEGRKPGHQLDIHVCTVLFPKVQVTNRSISGVEGFGFWKGCF